MDFAEDGWADSQLDSLSSRRMGQVNIQTDRRTGRQTVRQTLHLKTRFRFLLSDGDAMADTMDPIVPAKTVKKINLKRILKTSRFHTRLTDRCSFRQTELNGPKMVLKRHGIPQMNPEQGSFQVTTASNQAVLNSAKPEI